MWQIRAASREIQYPVVVNREILTEQAIFRKITLATPSSSQHLLRPISNSHALPIDGQKVIKPLVF